MFFEPTTRGQEWIDRVDAFMQEYVYPAEEAHTAQQRVKPFDDTDTVIALRARARSLGLWNLFLPHGYGPTSPSLTNLEYAPVAELMGRSEIGAACFNCDAPDSGNMETLAKYGTPEQNATWLQPLLEGKIKSGFAMSEVAVASSDATNIRTSIISDGDDYVINGHKYYTSNACHAQCKILIVMGRTGDDSTERHRRHSQILVPTNTPGVRVLRSLQVFGYDDSPGGHAEIVFENVRVPRSNLLLGEGRGFEIAQGRLGPGRIHHCMRLIGRAQRAFELMCARANTRVAFGKKLSEQQSVREDIARSVCEIEQARLLTLKAAAYIDRYGAKGARNLIGMIKIVAPTMACNVIDRAIQIHGAAGVSQDTMLAHAFSYARKTRITDGPDQVHMMQLGRSLALSQLTPEKPETHE